MNLDEEEFNEEAKDGNEEPKDGNEAAKDDANDEVYSKDSKSEISYSESVSLSESVQQENMISTVTNKVSDAILCYLCLLYIVQSLDYKFFYR